MDSVAVTWIMLDPLMAVLRPLAAVLSAIATGLAVDATTKPEPPKPALLPMAPASGKDADEKPKRPRLKTRLASGMRYGMVDLAADIGPWFLIGVAVAGAVTVFLPAGFVQEHVGGRWGGYFLALALSLPIYVCATASTPLAAALAWQGLSPGAALVFLLAGPATNIASLAVTTRILGKKETAVYLVSLVVCSLLMGLFADAVYSALGMSGNWAGGDIEAGAGIFEYATAAAFFVLGYLGIRAKRKGEADCDCC